MQSILCGVSILISLLGCKKQNPGLTGLSRNWMEIEQLVEFLRRTGEPDSDHVEGQREQVQIRSWQRMLLTHARAAAEAFCIAEVVDPPAAASANLTIFVLCQASPQES